MVVLEWRPLRDTLHIQSRFWMIFPQRENSRPLLSWLPKLFFTDVAPDEGGRETSMSMSSVFSV